MFHQVWAAEVPQPGEPLALTSFCLAGADMAKSKNHTTHNQCKFLGPAHALYSGTDCFNDIGT
jgi:hypothetical protein